MIEGNTRVLSQFLVLESQPIIRLIEANSGLLSSHCLFAVS